MTAKQRIALIARETGYSINALAKKIGVTRGNLNNIMAEQTMSISANVATHIIDAFPEYDIEWLLTGTGDPHTTKTTTILGHLTDTKTGIDYAQTTGDGTPENPTKTDTTESEEREPIVSRALAERTNDNNQLNTTINAIIKAIQDLQIKVTKQDEIITLLKQNIDTLNTSMSQISLTLQLLTTKTL